VLPIYNTKNTIPTAVENWRFKPWTFERIRSGKSLHQLKAVIYLMKDSTLLQRADKDARLLVYDVLIDF
jgi:hypothetical protein